MEGFIIDYQADSGPDYIFRQVVVIVDVDENAAKKQFIDSIDYPEAEKYLSMGLEEMVKKIIEDDPEDYFTGAGWKSSFNHVKKYNQVPSKNPSCETFIISLDGDEVIEVIFDIEKSVKELNDYIQSNLGVPPLYSVDDFLSDANLGDYADLFINGISPLTLLKTMMDKGIIKR
jgi:hypothetical protein